MRELSFVVDTVMGLVVGAFLLRLLLQLVRTDYRNPLAQTLSRLTNPVIVPLRRILPSIGRIDTASVVATLGAQLLRSALLMLFGGGVAGFGVLIVLASVDLLDTALLLYLGAIFVVVLLSWVAPDGYNPAGRLLADLTGPLLRPLRRSLPPLGGLDLSPMVAILLLSVLRMVLNGRIAPLLASLVQ